MPALKTERRVFLWQLQARVAPYEAIGKKTATLDDAICVLEAAQSAGTARVYLSETSRILDDGDPAQDDGNQIYVAEIKRNPEAETVTILINRGDPEAVSPAFINTTTNEVRVENPGKQESPGWSAHLVISTSDVGGMHRACFEQMPHVSSSLVMTAIDRMTERALASNPSYRFEIVRMEKNKQKIFHKPYWPHLVASRVPSERLTADLEKGELSAVTLTRKRTFYAGVGVSSLVKRQEEKVVLSLRAAEKSTVATFLDGLIKHAKEEQFESVTFHIDNLPGNQTNHPTLKLDDQDALEHLYVRAKRLDGFETVLQQCYGSICDEMERKMIHLVNDIQEWG